MCPLNGKTAERKRDKSIASALILIKDLNPENAPPIFQPVGHPGQIDQVVSEVVPLADGLLGIEGTVIPEMRLLNGASRCFHDPADNICTAYVDDLFSDDSLASAMRALQAKGHAVSIPEAKLLAYIAHAYLILHEAVAHGRIRAHSNKGSNAANVLSGADALSEGFAYHLPKAIVKKLSEKEKGHEAKAWYCAYAALEMRHLLDLFGINTHAGGYGMQIEQVEKELAAGRDLSEIYHQNYLKGREETSIGAQDIVPLETVVEVLQLEKEIREAVERSKYPESKVAKLIATKTYAKDPAVRSRAQAKTTKLYLRIGDHAGKIKETLEKVMKIMPGVGSGKRPALEDILRGKKKVGVSDLAETATESIKNIIPLGLQKARNIIREKRDVPSQEQPALEGLVVEDVDHNGLWARLSGALRRLVHQHDGFTGGLEKKGAEELLRYVAERKKKGKPDDIRLIGLEVWALIALGRFKEAYESSSLIPDSSNDPVMLMLKLQAAYADGRYEDALRIYENSVPLQNQRYDGFWLVTALIGDLQVLIGREDEAIEFYQTSLEHMPRGRRWFDASVPIYRLGVYESKDIVLARVKALEKKGDIYSLRERERILMRIEDPQKRTIAQVIADHLSESDQKDIEEKTIIIHGRQYLMMRQALGKGSGGRVHLTQLKDLGTGEITCWVVKVPRNAGDKTGIEKERREYEIHLHANKRGLADKVYAFGAATGKIVMEETGEKWRDMNPWGAANLVTDRRFLESLGEELNNLHTAGIVHNDLPPIFLLGPIKVMPGIPPIYPISGAGNLLTLEDGSAVKFRDFGASDMDAENPGSLMIAQLEELAKVTRMKDPKGSEEQCKLTVYDAYMESGGLIRILDHLQNNPQELITVKTLLPEKWAEIIGERTTESACTAKQEPVAQQTPAAARTIVYDTDPRQAIKRLLDGNPLEHLLDSFDSGYSVRGFFTGDLKIDRKDTESDSKTSHMLGDVYKPDEPMKRFYEHHPEHKRPRGTYALGFFPFNFREHKSLRNKAPLNKLKSDKDIVSENERLPKNKKRSVVALTTKKEIDFSITAPFYLILDTVPREMDMFVAINFYDIEDPVALERIAYVSDALAILRNIYIARKIEAEDPASAGVFYAIAKQNLSTLNRKLAAEIPGRWDQPEIDEFYSSYSLDPELMLRLIPPVKLPGRYLRYIFKIHEDTLEKTGKLLEGINPQNAGEKAYSAVKAASLNEINARQKWVDEKLLSEPKEVMTTISEALFYEIRGHDSPRAENGAGPTARQEEETATGFDQALKKLDIALYILKNAQSSGIEKLIEESLHKTVAELIGLIEGKIGRIRSRTLFTPRSLIEEKSRFELPARYIEKVKDIAAPLMGYQEIQNLISIAASKNSESDKAFCILLDWYAWDEKASKDMIREVYDTSDDDILEAVGQVLTDLDARTEGYKHGLELFDKGEYENASKEFARVEKSAPGYQPARVNRELCHYLGGQLPEALAYFSSRGLDTGDLESLEKLVSAYFVDCSDDPRSNALFRNAIAISLCDKNKARDYVTSLGGVHLLPEQIEAAKEGKNPLELGELKNKYSDAEYKKASKQLDVEQLDAIAKGIIMLVSPANSASRMIQNVIDTMSSLPWSFSADNIRAAFGGILLILSEGGEQEKKITYAMILMQTISIKPSAEPEDLKSTIEELYLSCHEIHHPQEFVESVVIVASTYKKFLEELESMRQKDPELSKAIWVVDDPSMIDPTKLREMKSVLAGVVAPNLPTAHFIQVLQDNSIPALLSKKCVEKARTGHLSTGDTLSFRFSKASNTYVLETRPGETIDQVPAFERRDSLGGTSFAIGPALQKAVGPVTSEALRKGLESISNEINPFMGARFEYLYNQAKEKDKASIASIIAIVANEGKYIESQLKALGIRQDAGGAVAALMAENAGLVCSSFQNSEELLKSALETAWSMVKLRPKPLDAKYITSLNLIPEDALRAELSVRPTVISELESFSSTGPEQYGLQDTALKGPAKTAADRLRWIRTKVDTEAYAHDMDLTAEDIDYVYGLFRQDMGSSIMGITPGQEAEAFACWATWAEKGRFTFAEDRFDVKEAIRLLREHESVRSHDKPTPVPVSCFVLVPLYVIVCRLKIGVPAGIKKVENHLFAWAVDKENRIELFGEAQGGGPLKDEDDVSGMFAEAFSLEDHRSSDERRLRDHIQKGEYEQAEPYAVKIIEECDRRRGTKDDFPRRQRYGYYRLVGDYYARWGQTDARRLKKAVECYAKMLGYSMTDYCIAAGVSPDEFKKDSFVPENNREKANRLGIKGGGVYCPEAWMDVWISTLYQTSRQVKRALLKMDGEYAYIYASRLFTLLELDPVEFGRLLGQLWEKEKNRGLITAFLTREETRTHPYAPLLEDLMKKAGTEPIASAQTPDPDLIIVTKREITKVPSTDSFYEPSRSFEIRSGLASGPVGQKPLIGSVWLANVDKNAFWEMRLDLKESLKTSRLARQIEIDQRAKFLEKNTALAGGERIIYVDGAGWFQMRGTLDGKISLFKIRPENMPEPPAHMLISKALTEEIVPAVSKASGIESNSLGESIRDRIKPLGPKDIVERTYMKLADDSHPSLTVSTQGPITHLFKDLKEAYIPHAVGEREGSELQMAAHQLVHMSDHPMAQNEGYALLTGVLAEVYLADLWKDISFRRDAEEEFAYIFAGSIAYELAQKGLGIDEIVSVMRSTGMDERALLGLLGEDYLYNRINRGELLKKTRRLSEICKFWTAGGKQKGALIRKEDYIHGGISSRTLTRLGKEDIEELLSLKEKTLTEERKFIGSYDNKGVAGNALKKKGSTIDGRKTAIEHELSEIAKTRERIAAGDTKGLSAGELLWRVKPRTSFVTGEPVGVELNDKAVPKTLVSYPGVNEALDNLPEWHALRRFSRAVTPGDLEIFEPSSIMIEEENHILDRLPFEKLERDYAVLSSGGRLIAATIPHARMLVSDKASVIEAFDAIGYHELDILMRSGRLIRPSMFADLENAALFSDALGILEKTRLAEGIRNTDPPAAEYISAVALRDYLTLQAKAPEMFKGVDLKEFADRYSSSASSEEDYYEDVHGTPRNLETDLQKLKKDLGCKTVSTDRLLLLHEANGAIIEKGLKELYRRKTDGPSESELIYGILIDLYKNTHQYRTGWTKSLHERLSKETIGELWNKPSQEYTLEDVRRLLLLAGEKHSGHALNAAMRLMRWGVEDDKSLEKLLEAKKKVEEYGIDPGEQVREIIGYRDVFLMNFEAAKAALKEAHSKEVLIEEKIRRGEEAEEEEYSGAIDYFENAERQFKFLLGCAPERPDLAVLRNESVRSQAGLLRETKENDHALILYRRIVKDDPTDTGSWRGIVEISLENERSPLYDALHGANQIIERNGSLVYEDWFFNINEGLLARLTETEGMTEEELKEAFKFAFYSLELFGEDPRLEGIVRSLELLKDEIERLNEKKHPTDAGARPLVSAGKEVDIDRLLTGLDASLAKVASETYDAMKANSDLDERARELDETNKDRISFEPSISLAGKGVGTPEWAESVSNLFVKEFLKGDFSEYMMFLSLKIELERLRDMGRDGLDDDKKVSLMARRTVNQLKRNSVASLSNVPGGLATVVRSLMGTRDYANKYSLTFIEMCYGEDSDHTVLPEIVVEEETVEEKDLFHGTCNIDCRYSIDSSGKAVVTIRLKNTKDKRPILWSVLLDRLIHEMAGHDALYKKFGQKYALFLGKDPKAAEAIASYLRNRALKKEYRTFRTRSVMGYTRALVNASNLVGTGNAEDDHYTAYGTALYALMKETGALGREEEEERIIGKIIERSFEGAGFIEITNRIVFEKTTNRLVEELGPDYSNEFVSFLSANREFLISEGATIFVDGLIRLALSGKNTAGDPLTVLKHPTAILGLAAKIISLSYESPETRDLPVIIKANENLTAVGVEVSENGIEINYNPSNIWTTLNNWTNALDESLHLETYAHLWDIIRRNPQLEKLILDYKTEFGSFPSGKTAFSSYLKNKGLLVSAGNFERIWDGLESVCASIDHMLMMRLLGKRLIGYRLAEKVPYDELKKILSSLRTTKSSEMSESIITFLGEYYTHRDAVELTAIIQVLWIRTDPQFLETMGVMEQLERTPLPPSWHQGLAISDSIGSTAYFQAHYEYVLQNHLRPELRELEENWTDPDKRRIAYLKVFDKVTSKGFSDGIRDSIRRRIAERKGEEHPMKGRKGGKRKKGLRQPSKKGNVRPAIISDNLSGISPKGEGTQENGSELREIEDLDRWALDKEMGIVKNESTVPHIEETIPLQPRSYKAGASQSILPSAALRIKNLDWLTSTGLEKILGPESITPDGRINVKSPSFHKWALEALIPACAKVIGAEGAASGVSLEIREGRGRSFFRRSDRTIVCYINSSISEAQKEALSKKLSEITGQSVSAEKVALFAEVLRVFVAIEEAGMHGSMRTYANAQMPDAKGQVATGAQPYVEGFAHLGMIEAIKELGKSSGDLAFWGMVEDIVSDKELMDALLNIYSVTGEAARYMGQADELKALMDANGWSLAEAHSNLVGTEARDTGIMDEDLEILDDETVLQRLIERIEFHGGEDFPVSLTARLAVSAAYGDEEIKRIAEEAIPSLCEKHLEKTEVLRLLSDLSEIMPG